MPTVSKSGVLTALAIATAVILMWAFNAIGIIPERRPRLLRDARWNEEASARGFNERFRAGAPESDLTGWLRAYDFELEAPGHALRLVRSFPCNEVIRVDWTTDRWGALQKATARVSEAGCT